MTRLRVSSIVALLLAVIALGWSFKDPVAVLGAEASLLPRIIRVSAGGDLQAAINGARPGDFIELQAGATFVGNFRLPDKEGARWIVIYSSAFWRLPRDRRVSPADAGLMPKIKTPNREPAVRTDPGAHHYALAGIEITTTYSPPADQDIANLVKLETPEAAPQTLENLPSNIILYRCYIHGTPTGEVRRGVALNGARLAVIGSYLSDFHETSADSQAIAGWKGPGPFTIVGNYLEAAGENLLFGGGDPSISGLVPSNIEIRGNHLAKQLAWKADEPTYAGIPWIVKNLLELKNARRVRVDGNIFEYNWRAAQDGFAVLFTVRNQEGAAPWSVVEDVTFVNNIIRHTANGIHLLGWDNNAPSEQTKRILVKNNVFDDVGTPRWGGGGHLFFLVDGTRDVVIDHNTAFQTGRPVAVGVIDAARATHTGFVFTNNITLNNQGVGGENSLGNPLDTLRILFPGYAFTHNALVGGDAAAYPAGNFFPASLAAVGFVDVAGCDYRLTDTSPYRNAGTDGDDLGVDFPALTAALSLWGLSVCP